jgi:hypothetical protein
MLVEGWIRGQIAYEGMGSPDLNGFVATGAAIELPCDGERKANGCAIVSLSLEALAAVWDGFHPNILPPTERRRLEAGGAPAAR